MKTSLSRSIVKFFHNIVFSKKALVSFALITLFASNLSLLCMESDAKALLIEAERLANSLGPARWVHSLRQPHALRRASRSACSRSWRTGPGRRNHDGHHVVLHAGVRIGANVRIDDHAVICSSRCGQPTAPRPRTSSSPRRSSVTTASWAPGW